MDRAQGNFYLYASTRVARVRGRLLAWWYAAVRRALLLSRFVWPKRTAADLLLGGRCGDGSGSTGWLEGRREVVDSRPRQREHPSVWAPLTTWRSFGPGHLGPETMQRANDQRSCALQTKDVALDERGGRKGSAADVVTPEPPSSTPTPDANNRETPDEQRVGKLGWKAADDQTPVDSPAPAGAPPLQLVGGALSGLKKAWPRRAQQTKRLFVGRTSTQKRGSNTKPTDRLTPTGRR
ncbi:uncharacterized protein PSFLO_07645 [Pseudozyma flocculosa]|uniref:Uncharacterized protein n=1 Tax=Pseudozyma flocculosa TaxID=84751 RepID=A0A5C3FCN0_9BASI|nr:uncharacterized protein PSFLO_07645 [Pseudozyma flocculosa]